MTEFYWILLAVVIIILFFVIGYAIDKFKQFELLKDFYQCKTIQCEVSYEAMLLLIREFTREELELCLKDYSERLCSLYLECKDNEELIKIYELLVEQIELHLSSLDADDDSSGGIGFEA